ncbi:carbamoyl phosphate synthase large subunit [Kaistia sp. 32K]|uniref:ATP-grasp domain-containing protein n=1 Tax=Kaistia sp. 32K TaxID=2795690 RepID=UPI001916AD79|nr:ATP-grasp domain-containing protein [Kaistia sp. 32K]BCP53911.1 carbamoyl phosphate synthase large subunit [Kaistia sp. 32K]
MKHLTLLISSAGRRVGLIDCFRQSAASMGVSLEVLACDLEPGLSAACNAADRAFAVPAYGDPAFVDALIDIVREHGVDLVVPTIDPELAPLAAAIDRFSALGARVHVSPSCVIEVARDKLRTAEVLEQAGVPVPWTRPFGNGHLMDGLSGWPAFLKPSAGSASRGIRIVEGPAELPEAVDEPMVLQQFLVGPEFTVNMFIDQGGVLRSAVAHRRLRVRAGEVEKGRTERDPIFRELAEGVARALPEARGVLCFQVILDAATGPRVFEINARFGGGYPLAHHAGAEYARWLLEEVAALPSTAHDDWRAGVLMLRYDAAIFEG